MSDQEKTTWRKWLEENPTWVKPLATFFNGRPGLTRADVPARMFWHDLINVLVPFYMKLTMPKGGGRA